MADFTLQVTSGAAVVDWLDPASSSDKPSRLNPRPGFPHKRWLGSAHTPIVLSAVVDGAVAPLDSALGGRLFSAWAVECPVPPLPIQGDSGRSSIQRFTPLHPGHYTIGVRRPNGGLEHVHVDVE